MIRSLIRENFLRCLLVERELIPQFGKLYNDERTTSGKQNWYHI